MELVDGREDDPPQLRLEYYSSEKRRKSPLGESQRMAACYKGVWPNDTFQSCDWNLDGKGRYSLPIVPILQLTLQALVTHSYPKYGVAMCSQVEVIDISSAKHEQACTLTCDQEKWSG